MFLLSFKSLMNFKYVITRDFENKWQLYKVSNLNKNSNYKYRLLREYK